MSIELIVRPQFREDWTAVTITGEYEEDILNILVSRLDAAEYEIFIESSAGDLVPHEEYEYVPET